MDTKVSKGNVYMLTYAYSYNYVSVSYPFLYVLKTMPTDTYSNPTL